MDSTELQHRLAELAKSHLWTWDPRLSELLDQAAASKANGPATSHPTSALAELSASQVDALLADETLTADLDRSWTSATSYLDQSVEDPSIAYFSPEFGISERVPQYSGGLGILAGDHLKAASDLGLALTGVGLFYRQGFFRQGLENGNQSERYETYEPTDLGAVDSGLVVEVPMAERTVEARVWLMKVGRVSMVLLDTALDSNQVEDRAITDRLYSGDRRHRLEQEMILGVGGVRALNALGWRPPLFHLNEGHAGFLLFELIDQEVSAGRSLSEALTVLEPHLLFTTHTPVPAGIDRFSRDLVDPYLAPWAERWDVAIDDVAALASDEADEASGGGEFNMAVMCLNASSKANGVSKLHGTVSRELFGHIPKGKAIGSITNGVHARTWTSAHVQEAFDEIAGPTWAEGDAEAWDKIASVDETTVRNLRRRGGEVLSKMVVERTGISLDPTIPTIGFARRFATYKRADLLLRNRELLEELLAEEDTPVQFVFAGKAHPADNGGKELLARIVEFSQSPAARSRFVFVHDYDIAVAAAMYAGCDVWLNNPVRPREASGTSGEKAALNGSLNFSISDGWWDEMATDLNGWTIPSSDSTDETRRDLDESLSALTLLSDEIVPTYWASGDPWSSAWIDRVRACWRTLGPQVTAARMVGDYRDQYYQPMLKALSDS